MPQTTARGRAILDEFWRKRTTRIFGVQDARDRWVAVYKVLDDAESLKPHVVDDMFAVYAGRLKPR